MKNKRVQKLSEQKLLQYGCSKEGMTYRCIRKLKAPDFYAVITYEGQELHAEVYDAQLREPYTPFHVPGVNGSFVSSIREEVEGFLKKSKEELFNLRFQSATGQLENTARLKAVKHDIARMYTILRERELGISQAPEATETKAEEK